MRARFVLLVLVAAILLAGCATQETKQATPTPTPTTPAKTTWVWATLDPGGYGYRVIVGILDTVKADLPNVEFLLSLTLQRQLQ